MAGRKAKLRLGLATTRMYVQHDGRGVTAQVLSVGRRVRLTYCADSRIVVLRLGHTENACNVCNIAPGKNADNTHQVTFLVQNPRVQEMVDFLPNFCVDELDFEMDPDTLSLKGRLPETHLLPWGRKPQDEHDAMAVFAKGLRLRLRSAFIHDYDPAIVLRRRPGWSEGLLDREHFRDIVREETP